MPSARDNNGNDHNDRSDILETWKAIAAYVGRDVRTVMRWEKDRGLPVHWVPGGGRRAVYAYKCEIDAWFGKTCLNKTLSRTTNPLRAESDQSRPVGPAGPARVDVSSANLPFGFLHLTADRRVAWSAAVIVVLIIWVATVARRTLNIPAEIQHYVKITLKNSQSTAAPPAFEQLIDVPSSVYASVEAAHLENVEFFDSTGRILHSWLESGNSRNATHSIYWLQLPNGIPAKGALDIYLGFADRAQNLFNAASVGEAPNLSAQYAQYDNGVSVFSRYANFNGNELPQGWYKTTTPGGQGGVDIQDGVRLYHSGRGGGEAFLGSDWALGENIAEMDMLHQETTRGQEMLFVCSSSPSHFKWTGDSVGYQDMSGLEVEANNNGTPLVVALAKPNPPPSSIIGLHDNAVFANYRQVAQTSSRICGADFLASSVNTGLQASFSFDWIRLRLPPPNSSMPSPSFSALK